MVLSPLSLFTVKVTWSILTSLEHLINHWIAEQAVKNKQEEFHKSDIQSSNYYSTKLFHWIAGSASVDQIIRCSVVHNICSFWTLI